MEYGSSDESDDEFLTVRDKSGGNVDREAMIRKKLLENFYGKSSADAASSEAGEVKANTSSPDLAGSRQPAHTAGVVQERRNSADTKDLDSPYFDATAHTSHHVASSSVQKLLEMDEQLTLQVRTLDSSTQNMVYENYSKFIDATEAVKSVGVNVQANEQGLERLRKGMDTINEQSRLVEEDLGTLRDAVAEKIRVKRLLTRLDALLKLPETLREQIAAGKYRTAAATFCRSTNILSKHSAGFESLQKIETKCNGIITETMKELNRKILYWSGQETSLAGVGSTSSDDDNNYVSEDYETAADGDVGEFELPPDAPRNISEIFECSGTLAMLVMEQPARINPEVSLDALKSMSMSASMRFLDRVFDTHQLEIQEATFSSISEPVTDESGAFEGDTSARSHHSQQGQHLIPCLVIDAILEASTLYVLSFNARDSRQSTSDAEKNYLEDFVTEAYSAFLGHVRSILLEQSMSSQMAIDMAASEGQQNEADVDEAYEDVAGAMAILLHAVRELASGLTLPEVGIDADVAADMVERASELTEALVRRRVEQKFCDLRLRVVNDCLVPFTTRVAGKDEPESDPSAERMRVLQVVDIAVSDCLQLLDDAVKSIVSGRNILGASAASVDLAMLKQSIQASTSRFAFWLAGTLEILAGCDSSDPMFSFEARREYVAQNDDNVVDGLEGRGEKVMRIDQDSKSVLSAQMDPVAEQVDSAIQELIANQLVGGNGESIASLDLALKICEMCRGCERAFVDSMNQSIEANVGGGKKGRSSDLFPMDDTRKSAVLSDYQRKSTERFRLAASRILSLYATDRAFDAVDCLCLTTCQNSSVDSDVFPEGPTSAVCQVLKVAKLASLDCANHFDENVRGGPPPSFSNMNGGSQHQLGMNASPLKGLQLDVERMFKETVSIFPDTLETIDMSRNAVLTVFFRVVVKALYEQTRQCTFSSYGYNRLLVDVELLREFIPHYVDDDFQMQGTEACSSLFTLLTEVMTSAGERCIDDECLGNESLVRSAWSALRNFVKSDPDTSNFILAE